MRATSRNTATVLAVLRMYLDTQQYAYLSEGPRNDSLGIDLGLLQNCVERRDVQIVGPLVVFQELLLQAPDDPGRFDAQNELLVELAGPRVLLPLDQRHEAEATTGGRLTSFPRYLQHELRRAVWEQVRNGDDLAAVIGDVVDEKSAYQMTEGRTRDAVRRAIREHGAKPTLAMMKAWFASIDVADLNKDVVEAGVARGLYDTVDTPCDFDRYPSSWLFAAYRLSRMVYTLGEGQRIQASDLADAHHVSAGAYYDILVTDDKRLRQTLDLIPDLPFEVLRSSEVEARIS